jgi:hypothetical protein
MLDRGLTAAESCQRRVVRPERRSGSTSANGFRGDQGGDLRLPARQGGDDFVRIVVAVIGALEGWSRPET